MKKTFDTVEMTRRIRDAHAEQLKNATPDERIRFYREKAQRFHRSLQRPPAGSDATCSSGD